MCPTLRGQIPKSLVPEGIGSVLEIVIDGLGEQQVREAMARGLDAAARAGATLITAGNYGGNLGPFQLHLHDLAGATEE
jgi:formylmethanofuran--tetrahydromethanopterin N-formyltransferase